MVPALIDNNAKIDLNKDGDAIVTKPHGHGDIHSLLYSSGLAKQWRDDGLKWMFFF